jgi:hypothetical protein
MKLATPSRKSLPRSATTCIICDVGVPFVGAVDVVVTDRVLGEMSGEACAISPLIYLLIVNADYHICEIERCFGNPATREIVASLFRGFRHDRQRHARQPVIEKVF